MGVVPFLRRRSGGPLLHPGLGGDGAPAGGRQCRRIPQGPAANVRTAGHERYYRFIALPAFLALLRAPAGGVLPYGLSLEGARRALRSTFGQLGVRFSGAASIGMNLWSRRGACGSLD